MIMDYREFARFLETEEGQRRKDRFEIVGNRDDESGAIYMEFSSREEALATRRERYHSEYLKKQEAESGYTTLSLDALAETEDEDGITLLDMIGGDGEDTEETVYEMLLKQNLPGALVQLNGPEAALAAAFYEAEEKMSENRYAKLTGEPRRRIHERHQSVKRKLRLYYRRKRLL